MAKPWHPSVNRLTYNRPDIPEGPGAGGLETGAEASESEEGGGKQGDKAAPPPPPKGQDQWQEIHKSAERGDEREEEVYD